DPPGRPGGTHPVAGGAPALAADVPGLPRARARARPGDGRTVQGSPGPGRLARVERAGLPQHLRLLRRRGAGLPHVAAAAVRNRRRAERRLVDELLVAALRRLGRAPPTPPGGSLVLPQPGPAAGFQAVLLRRAEGVPAGGTGRPARAHARRP